MAFISTRSASSWAFSAAVVLGAMGCPFLGAALVRCVGATVASSSFARNTRKRPPTCGGRLRWCSLLLGCLGVALDHLGVGHTGEGLVGQPRGSGLDHPGEFLGLVGGG